MWKIRPRGLSPHCEFACESHYKYLRTSIAISNVDAVAFVCKQTIRRILCSIKMTLCIFLVMWFLRSRKQYKWGAFAQRDKNPSVGRWTKIEKRNCEEKESERDKLSKRFSFHPIRSIFELKSMVLQMLMNTMRLMYRFPILLALVQLNELKKGAVSYVCCVCILDVESFINGLNTMWHQSHTVE